MATAQPKMTVAAEADEPTNACKTGLLQARVVVAGSESLTSVP